MIELGFNLVWLAIAIAISVTFLPRQRGRAVAFVAVACLIALLFPIVSISDDLGHVRDAFEESNATRRALNAAGHSDQLPAATHPAVFVALDPPLTLCAIGRVEIEDALVRHFVFAPRTNPRSPPSL